MYLEVDLGFPKPCRFFWMGKRWEKAISFEWLLSKRGGCQGPLSRVDAVTPTVTSCNTNLQELGYPREVLCDLKKDHKRILKLLEYLWDSRTRVLKNLCWIYQNLASWNSLEFSN